VDNPLGGIQSFLEKFKPPFLCLHRKSSLHPHTLVAEPHPRLAPDLYEWIDVARSHRGCNQIPFHFSLSYLMWSSKGSTQRSGQSSVKHQLPLIDSDLYERVESPFAKGVKFFKPRSLRRKIQSLMRSLFICVNRMNDIITLRFICESNE
jgi:hypothetical protein